MGVHRKWPDDGQNGAFDPTFLVKYRARPSCGDEQCLQPRSRPTCFTALVEGDDFDPVCALSCRVASDRLQRAGLGVDRVGRDRVRQFAGDDYEAAGRVDIETARLLLGRRASEIGELSARGIDAEGAQRARCALRGVEKAAVWREVKIRCPDIVGGVPRGLVRAGRPDGSTRYTGDELGVRGQHRHGVEFLERPGVRVERQRCDHAGQLVEQIDEAVVGRNDQVTRP